MNPYSLSLPRRRFAETDPGKREPEKTALMNEISSSESDVLRAMSPYGQNQDPVVRSKGLKIYKDMMEDDQVKVCVEMRKHSRLASGWTIVPGDAENSQSVMYADFIKHVINRMRGTFEDDLYEIYSAIEYGFSISELNFLLLPDGPFAGKIGLESIKTREPFNYDFKIDPYGNLEGLVYLGVTPQNVNLVSKIADPRARAGEANWGTLANPYPPEKFIIYSYNSQFGNQYGRSDLLSAFRSWMSKKIVMRFWNVWLERYASPFIWVTIDPDVILKKGTMDEIDDFLKNLSARSGFRCPKGVTLNVAQSAAQANAAYADSVESHNRYIAHAILFPNLLGFTGSQGTGGSGGSYSLGKTHMDAFVWVLNKMGRDTSETIVGEQIIARLINLNFPNVDDTLMPRFKFEGADEDSIKLRADIIKTLGDGGFINVEEEWIREFLTLPKKDPSIKLERPVIGAGFGAPKPGENGDEKDPEAEKKMKAFRERDARMFEEKLDAKRYGPQLDKAEAALFSAMSEDVGAMRDYILKFVAKNNPVGNQDPKALDKMVINPGDLKRTVYEWLVKVHLDSKLKAFEEIGSGGVGTELKKNFSEADEYTENAALYPWSPLPPSEAVDFFNRKVKAYIVGESGKKTLVELASMSELPYYDRKAFAIAGVVRDDILNHAKQIILSGIKRQDEPGTVKDLKDMFNKYLDSGIAVDGDLLSPHRLATIARTNIVEAVNEGRRSIFEDPAVAEFVQFWEYSAVLDDRTTEYCSCMDGKVFRVEDIAMLNPPAHYNCRSLSVPVTKYEVEDLVAAGRGVEVSGPCKDRAENFSSGGFFIPANPLLSTPTACPYSACRSSKIAETGRKYNYTEFTCESCKLPFRMTDTGDMYLFESPTEQWVRMTRGLTPSYFKKER